jgi:putative transposase
MTAAVCAALGVSRASVQRRRCRLAAPPAIARQRPKPTRALSDPQQQVVLDLLHAPRFTDQAPAEIYASLLDEGVYHCSIRTMYRILGQHGEVRERREQLRHPAYRKPELIAERPNQVWSWDITKLMGPTKWSFWTSSVAAWWVGAWLMQRAPRCSGRYSMTPLQNTTCFPVSSPCTPIAAAR